MTAPQLNSDALANKSQVQLSSNFVFEGANAFRVVVHNLTKEFGAVKALDGLSFSVGAGEIVGLLGPNGAGKTTALHLILGILRPTAGEVSVLGFSPFREPYKIYSRINFSSAYAALPFNLSLERNLRILAELYGVQKPKEKISQLTAMFGLSHLSKTATGALSSGEQTRLSLCKCLLNDPEIILLDEPTASLDPDMADNVRAILKNIRKERGITMLYTSHNMAEVEDLCDRVLFIHHGRKIVEGTPGEVQERFKEKSLKDVFIKISRGGDVQEITDKAEEVGKKS